MDKELMREIIASGSAALKDFAQAAKTTGEHVYGVLVRQQMVEGISMIIALILFIVSLATVWIRVVHPRYKKSKAKESYSSGDPEFFAGLSIFLFILFIGALCIFLSLAIQKVLNPEFFAIKFIFDTVKPR